MLRFEKLGKHDYAVYLDGESDAVGKAGMLCGEAWFLARESLGNGIAWGKTMTEAVAFWAFTQLRERRLREIFRQQLFTEALLRLERGEVDEN